MALSRNLAKKGILHKDQTDPEFTAAQITAHHTQLELTKEQNRHAQVMKERDLGALGKFFGDGRNTPTFISLLAVVSGILIYCYCLFSAKQNLENASFWSENASKALAFAGTALGYIFGRATITSRK
jgi:hypothetical protein